MSRKHIRNLINKANATHSTGPRSQAGKQRASLNAFKHGLSGQHLVLVDHEHEAYHQLCSRMLRDLKPKTEPEGQIAQKITDLNFRLNRLTAIETNMYNIDTVDHTLPTDHDDRVEVMCAQTRAWKADAHVFDTLGRYEARLSRQLHQYQKELERLQAIRKAEAAAKPAEENVSQLKAAKPVNPDLASFGNPVPAYVMRDDNEPLQSAA
jgi:hypothetical protein